MEICKTRHLALLEVVCCSKQPLHLGPAGETQSVRPGVMRLEVWLAKNKETEEEKKTQKNPKGPAAPLVDWLASRLDDSRGS